MSINDDMERLTVAAHNTITHWSDIGVRGYLKEHPDYALHDLALIEDMIRTVRAKAEAEKAEWGELNGDAHQDFEDQVADYRAHSCDCDYCYQQESAPVPEYVPGLIEDLFVPPTEERTQAPCTTCGRLQWNAAGDDRCHDCRKARNQ